jgi:hypothetical protein
MTAEEVRGLWQMFLFQCSQLDWKLTKDRPWVARHSGVRRFLKGEDRRLAELERALLTWDGMLLLVEARLRDFPERWEVPTSYRWRMN